MTLDAAKALVQRHAVPMSDDSEQLARREIDAQLAAAGWSVQMCGDLDLTAGAGWPSGSSP